MKSHKEMLLWELQWIEDFLRGKKVSSGAALDRCMEAKMRVLQCKDGTKFGDSMDSEFPEGMCL